MRILLWGALVLAGVALPLPAAFVYRFDPQAQRWDLSNGVIHSAFQLGPDGKFTLLEIDHVPSGKVWQAADGQASSPISVRLGATAYNANTPYSLVGQHVETPNPKTRRQVIVLEDLARTAQIQLQLEMYEGQPVLRHRVAISNVSLKPAYVSMADLAPYSFAADAQSYDLFRVAQWSVAPRPEDFQTKQIPLSPDGTPQVLVAGSGGSYCTWMAIRDENSRGLFVGWEFDGQSVASVRHQSAQGILSLRAAISSMYHLIAPGDTFTAPAGFIGLFQGNWDEAGFRTQRFVEAVLAQPAPAHFPYVSWDSWAYADAIDEQTLRRNAQIAASLGIELFVVDLGWARELGDWRDDPAKFPSGLRALSDYVHSLGMKFGLHFALAEAMADSPVLRANPDWTSSVSYNYYGALSLCLSNQDTRDWVIQQALQIIDDYHVDYLLQDGQNMVKRCTKTTHTHDPRDSNYSNAVEGIDAVVEEVRRLRPNVLWENCEDGGNMMTFNMVQHYVTSTTNDASGALGSRQAVFGATYPFPPRYADRYMPEDPASAYVTRSYMFGGPWHLMNQLPQMDSRVVAFAGSEIQIYKRMRDHISRGQVLHLTPAPAQGQTDALESYSAFSDSAVVIVTRDGDTADHVDLNLGGLFGSQSYQVRFQNDPRVLTMSGQALMTQGVRVNFPDMQSAEIVYLQPATAR